MLELRKALINVIMTKNSKFKLKSNRFLLKFLQFNNVDIIYFLKFQNILLQDREWYHS